MKKSLVILALAMAGSCLASGQPVYFQTCKSSISCVGTVSGEYAQFLEKGCTVCITELRTLPVILEQKGKSYVAKAGGASVKYQPATRKFIFKKKVKDSDEGEVTFGIYRIIGGVESCEVLATRGAVISARGVLMDDLDPSLPEIRLTFDRMLPSPADLKFPLAQKGRKYSVKGSQGGMDYNYVLTPKAETVKLAVKGGPFMCVNCFEPF